MGTSALGGFAQGLQQGASFADQRRRNRRIDRALEIEETKNLQAQEGRNQLLRAEGQGQLQVQIPDPVQSFWGRTFDKVKGMFDRGGQETAIDPGRMQAPTMQAQGGVPEYAIDTYADGGDVERRRGAAGPMAGYALARTLPRSLDRGEDRESWGDKFVPLGDDSREVGENVRYNVGEVIGPAVDSFRDNVVSPIAGAYSAIGDFAGGLLGTPKDDVPKDQAAAVSAAASQPNTERPPGTGGEQTTPPPASTGTGGVAPAGAEGQRQAVATEQPQGLQWSDVRSMPDEVPNFTTKNWQEYRGDVVGGLIAQGMSPADAHAQVDQIQMRGFQQNAQQALMYLQAGDPRSAALAMKGAYSYFPNGADVRFGMVNDVQGQPALVAMGRDEETGEPLGKPMAINQERLAVMIENLSNPSAWRTWTKDWRTEKFQREVFAAEAPLKKYKAETDRMNAEANRTRAISGGSGGAGGFKASDIRAFAGEVKDPTLDQLYMDPETTPVARRLLSIGEQIYQQSQGQLGPQQIMDAVMAAANGDQRSVDYLTQLGYEVPLIGE